MPRRGIWARAALRPARTELQSDRVLILVHTGYTHHGIKLEAVLLACTSGPAITSAQEAGSRKMDHRWVYLRTASIARRVGVGRREASPGTRDDAYRRRGQGRGRAGDEGNPGRGRDAGNAFWLARR